VQLGFNINVYSNHEVSIKLNSTIPGWFKI